MKTLTYAVLCVILLSAAACGECETIEATVIDTPTLEKIEVTVCN